MLRAPSLLLPLVALLSTAAVPAPAAANDDLDVTTGRVLFGVGVGLDAIELGLAVGSLAAAPSGGQPTIGMPQVVLSVATLSFTPAKVGGARVGLPRGGTDEFAHRTDAEVARALGIAWMETAVAHLLIGGLYQATALVLDRDYWSTDLILATVYGVMALPHVVLGAIALPVAIAALVRAARATQDGETARRGGARGIQLTPWLSADGAGGRAGVLLRW